MVVFAQTGFGAKSMYGTIGDRQMDDIDILAEKIIGIRDLAAEDKIGEALDRIREIEGQVPLPPNLLVYKALYIQTAETASYGLPDAEIALETALAIDDEHVEALIELGYFRYLKMEKEEEAISLFEDAIHICKRELAEAIEGYAKCLRVLKGENAALNYLATVKDTIIDISELEKLMDDIRKHMP
jgi:tetratricopeptide (TPR) repeat protein